MWRTGGESLLGLFLMCYRSCGEKMWAGKKLWNASGKRRREAAFRNKQWLLHRTCLIWEKPACECGSGFTLRRPCTDQWSCC